MTSSDRAIVYQTAIDVSTSSAQLLATAFTVPDGCNRCCWHARMTGGGASLDIQPIHLQPLPDGSGTAIGPLQTAQTVTAAAPRSTGAVNIPRGQGAVGLLVTAPVGAGTLDVVCLLWSEE